MTAAVIGSPTVVDLVARAQTGDRDAYGQLYARYRETVFRYVHFRVASWQLAEDLTQETFLRAMRRIDRFTWRGSDLGAWLVTIARNLVADHYKSSLYRRSCTNTDLVDDALSSLTDQDADPADTVPRQITVARLRAAVARLRGEQQQVIELRYLRELSVAETAAVMHKNEGAVKALAYRAVRALARMEEVAACR